MIRGVSLPDGFTLGWICGVCPVPVFFLRVYQVFQGFVTANHHPPSFPVLSLFCHTSTLPGLQTKQGCPAHVNSAKHTFHVDEFHPTSDVSLY